MCLTKMNVRGTHGLCFRRYTWALMPHYDVDLDVDR